MSLGPLMIDVPDRELTAEDRKLLTHPLIGGAILFSRNYSDPEQLTTLVTAIHGLRSPPLLVAVDHEGGRVQRFREGFSPLPPARLYGQVYDLDAGAGCRVAEIAAWLMAAELRATGVDMSFAPVMDVDHALSSVIGDRAFHSVAEVVGDLGRAWLMGMRRAGMVATAKHFPGHGGAPGDSHNMLPVDMRSLEEIRRQDLRAFERLIRLEPGAVMMAHVAFPRVDTMPASLSRRWIQGDLRERLGFSGAVFCDDLSMRAIVATGGYLDRARAALAAGCDMLPVCNDRAGAITILKGLDGYVNPVSQWRLARLHGREAPSWKVLHASHDWHQARTVLEGYYAGSDFKLDT